MSLEGLMDMRLVENQDYSWEAVKEKILSLKGRLGMKKSVKLLHVSVDDNGDMIFHDPRNGVLHNVDNSQVCHQIRRVLFYYSMGDDNFIVDPEQVSYTKISLLDDSMHLGCSTNQHRIEASFQAFFDTDPKAIKDVLETQFDTKRIDRGDIGFVVWLLPRVPALIVYNEGEDDEKGEDDGLGCLPSSLNIFFAKSAYKYLPPNVCETLEDIFLWEVSLFLS